MQREARSKEPKAALTPSAYPAQVWNPRRKPPPRSAIAARRFTPSSRTYSVHVLSTRPSPSASHRANARRATRLSAAWALHDIQAPTLARFCSRTSATRIGATNETPSAHVFHARRRASRAAARAWLTAASASCLARAKASHVLRPRLRFCTSSALHTRTSNLWLAHTAIHLLSAARNLLPTSIARTMHSIPCICLAVCSATLRHSSRAAASACRAKRVSARVIIASSAMRTFQLL